MRQKFEYSSVNLELHTSRAKTRLRATIFCSRKRRKQSAAGAVFSATFAAAGAR